MKKQTISAPAIKVPTANIAVNKSRVKLYEKSGDLPTYYLQKGQEFQIEIFNPTTDVVLAKITLNGKIISQGGLVLNPGQRVFLDRYLDVAKKFLFDTYEVNNTEEVKEAIENNGDFKVEFYRETKPVVRYNPMLILGNQNTGIKRFDDYYKRSIGSGTNTYSTNSVNGLNGYVNNTASTDISSLGGTLTNTTNTDNAFYSSCVSFDSVGDVTFTTSSSPIEKSLRSVKSKKTIETGRVEEGSYSDQKFTTVNKDFEWFAFHTVEAKLMPISQKVNTTADLGIKVYCTNCGSKLGKGHKFCSTCGTKA